MTASGEYAADEPAEPDAELELLELLELLPLLLELEFPREVDELAAWAAASCFAFSSAALAAAS